MKQVITGMDLYTEGDKDHPFAQIRIVPGQRYGVMLFGEGIIPPEEVPEGADPERGKYAVLRERFDSIDDAIIWAKAIEEYVKVDPGLMTPAGINSQNLLRDAEERHQREMGVLQQQLQDAQTQLAKSQEAIIPADSPKVATDDQG